MRFRRKNGGHSRWYRRVQVDSRARYRAASRLAATFVAIASILVGAPAPASADVIYPEVPLDGWDTDGIVRVVKIVGDTVYVGGTFTEVRPPGGGQSLPRSNLAAFDLDTGDVLPFAADTNNTVRAIESDGTTVWVGGSFNNIAGEHRSNLAALDAATGALLPGLDVSTNGAVHGLALSGGRLYAGGYFTNVDGVVQQRLASLDPVTGAPDPGFQANGDGGVRDLAVSDTGRLFAGGFFTTIGNQPWSFLAEIDPATGNGVGPGYQEMIAPMLDVDVSPDGTFVFAAVAGFQNRAAAWNTFDGERRWYHRAMGDTQAVSYYGGTLYFGFHEGFEGDETVRMLAADVITGELHDFRPSINSFFGVWAIDATADGLAVGGEFTIVSGVATRGIAMFESDGTPPDTTPPSKPQNLSMLPAAGGAVQLQWDASSDDRAVSHYRIYRDGTLVGATAETTFGDATAAEGTVYEYRVRASDLAGNLSAPSSPLEVRTWSSVIPPGDEWRHDDSPHSSSNWRSIGYNDGGWDRDDAELGFGDGDEATVLQSGQTTYYFRNSFTVPAGKEVVAANMGLIRDDGAVVYLNGQEVMRSNMPAGPIEPDTRASSTVSGSAEREWIDFVIDPSLFVGGDNVVAVEVHQRSPGSSDVSFDFRLDVDMVDQTFDNEAPSRPQGLVATARTSTRIRLNWDESTDNVGVTGYKIFRDGSQVATTTATTYLDKHLWPETEYAYKVYATDAAGNLSPRSVISRATTLADTVAPKKPKQATTSATSDSITLQWNPAFDNVGVSHYVVKSSGQLLGTTTDTSFTMTGLQPETNYHMSVRAVDLFGNRGPRVHRWTVTSPIVTSYNPIKPSHVWRYLDDGSSLSAAWVNAGYDDNSWATGIGEFGYGDGDEATVVDEGPTNDRHITTFFRSEFNIDSAAAVDQLRMRLVRDDGVVVYINGTEVFRDNLPTGPIDSETMAIDGISGAAEAEWLEVWLATDTLVDGVNSIAVEIHQKHRNSSDISFNLRLAVNP